ncbi:MAG: 4-methyl-5(B-hydroxyethyl)-thiazole monophosphate biosynthesis protein [Nitrosopumilaceae archaeon]|nr:4-methyl-5(B-hydroxyethyl)-thiazole monophosphate biosynthesis protein [Nitrosopumilaceae archaeon]
MSNITFTIPSVLNKGGGEKKIQVTASSILESFNKVSEAMGEDFKSRVLNDDGSPRSLINIYVNGKNARFSGGMDTQLKDGDEIYILPAVAGGSELSSKDIDRYSRQIMLEEIGYQGQLKLRSAKICVVGVGGLGNPITTRLVAMGVGKLRIIDRDVIELSNLHRQTMFDESDVGQVKVEVAAKKLKKLNPDVEIESLPISINDYTALDAVEGCDVVIDALDSVNARYALNKACVEKNIPFNLDFVTTRTFRADECSVCGTGKVEIVPKQELIIEELCGRNRGKRTFSITPTQKFEIDVDKITDLAKGLEFRVENQGELGLSMRTNDMSVSFMKRGSAVIVGPKDETDAVSLYKKLVSRK